MRGTRSPRLCVAGAVAASALTVAPAGVRAAEARDGRLTGPVDPFTGTANEGDTFPGAADGVTYDRTYPATGDPRSLATPRCTVGPRSAAWGTPEQAAPPVPR